MPVASPAIGRVGCAAIHDRFAFGQIADVDLIRNEATIIDDPAPGGRPLNADPDDEYMVLARTAAADALVSGDAHLLDLRDRLPVMTPAEILATLGG